MQKMLFGRSSLALAVVLFGACSETEDKSQPSTPPRAYIQCLGKSTSTASWKDFDPLCQGTPLSCQWPNFVPLEGSGSVFCTLDDCDPKAETRIVWKKDAGLLLDPRVEYGTTPKCAPTPFSVGKRTQAGGGGFGAGGFAAVSCLFADSYCEWNPDERSLNQGVVWRCEAPAGRDTCTLMHKKVPTDYDELHWSRPPSREFRDGATELLVADFD